LEKIVGEGFKRRLARKNGRGSEGEREKCGEKGQKKGRGEGVERGYKRMR
jgi:hypothetical protein